MYFQEKKHIYFVGIGGIGVSALAKYFLSRGCRISGSDERYSEILRDFEERGVEVFVGHKKSILPENIEMIIYSDAIPKENPERQEAKKRALPSLSYAEALGHIMEEYYGITVSGTNGKTTTTAMLGKIFEKADLDPYVVVGGKVPGWDGNIRLPANLKANKNEQFFIAEACEYRRNMLYFSPKEILLTNIEADHLDYYQDLDDVLSAFQEYTKKLFHEDILFYNADDENSASVARGVSCYTVSYGKDKNADLQVKNIRVETNEAVSGQSFALLYRGEELGKFFLPVPGEFNVFNALGAVAVALSHGVSKEKIRDALKEFGGTWRRFERIGDHQGRVIISDYAHHPSAVRKTIEGAKQFYPEKKILAVFQPHQKDRTKKLFADFVESFTGADGVILSEIYEVEGREGDIQVSSADLVEALKNRGGSNIFYAKDLTETKGKILEKIENFDVVLLMGAGSIYKVAGELIGEAGQLVSLTKKENAL